MKYRFEVNFEYIDVVRFPGESSGIIVETCDVDADNVSEAYNKVKDLVESKRKNPYCIVKMSSPKLLGVVCNCCKGEGVRNVSRRNTTTN